MSISYNKLSVRVHLDRIRDNFLMLRAKAPQSIAVIKSDAYGHGLIPVAKLLAAAGATTMAVGTVGEAMQLRESGFDGRIIALLGALDQEEACTCRVGRIVPFVFSLDHLRMISNAATLGNPIDVALKFDTGMARLGFSETQVPEVLDALDALPGVRLAIAASHLAVSDEPQNEAFTLEQHTTFIRVITALRAAGHTFEATIANSAALLAYQNMHHELQRPGIALYGANPLHGTPLAHLGNGLRPAMEVCTPILQVHDLPKGKSISYGRTFVARRDMRVAITAVGYADAYSRGLSNKGAMLINEHRAPIVGRVCMQMTAVDVTDIPSASSGDAAWLLGGPGPDPITPEELAGQWGTITYEAFCLLGLSPKTFVQP